MSNKLLLNRLWNSPTITTWMSFLSRSFNVTVIIPLVLNRLSTGDINLWYLFATVLGLQVLLDAGFGSAFVRIIAYGTVGLKNFSNLKAGVNEEDRSGEFDEGYIKNTYQIMKKIYVYIAAAAFVILITIGSIGFLTPISESSDHFIGWATWIFFSLSLPLVLYGNVYVNLLQGTQNIPLVRRWDTLFNLLNTCTSIVLLVLFPNVFLIVVINQVWLIIATIRNYYLTIRKYPFLKEKASDLTIQKEIRKNVIPSAVKSGVGILMSQGIIQTSGFFYAKLATPAELASFLTGLYFIQVIRNFAQAPFYSRLPEFATYTGLGELNTLKKVAKRSMFQVYLTYTLIFLVFGLFSGPVLAMIHSKVSFPDQKLWGLLGLAFLIDRYGAMHLQLYSTTNHIIWHVLNGVTGVLMIVLALLLYPLIGVYGLPLSMVLGYALFYSWYAPYKSYKLIRTNFWEFEWNSFLPYLICLLLFIVLNEGGI
ncbi:lipopolysaccharide biosynthesis protein [Larkinella soli]|uniref:lipopolysaccharide biosynthesis protein n=1 Tax=Larkinella soli TaxID=1770527 RepID=UPI000FFC1E15|nr:hypothetical protein [Larkinella soli]